MIDLTQIQDDEKSVNLEEIKENSRSMKKRTKRVRLFSDQTKSKRPKINKKKSMDDDLMF